jgi:DNA recombination protein RmuC
LSQIVPLTSWSLLVSIVVAAALLGGLLSYLYQRHRCNGRLSRLRQESANEIDSLESAADGRVARLEGELKRVRELGVIAARRLEAANQELRRMASGQGALKRLVEERGERAASLSQELATRAEHHRLDRERLIECERQLAAVEAREEERQQRLAEQQGQLSALRDALEQQFAHLAGDAIREQGEALLQRGATDIDSLVSPLRQQLEAFRGRIEEIHRADLSDRGSLVGELRQLQGLNRQITEEASNLTRALRGDVKRQGSWGELVLERVLESTGLRRDQEYRLQMSLNDQEGRRQRPDVVVLLPEGRHIVIDAKVSLVAYSDYIAAESGKEQTRALRAHVESVRNHIRTLAARDYTALPGLDTPDFVILFMPVEAAFSAAFSSQPALFDEAFEQRIVVAAPTTLWSTLRTVAAIWRHQRQDENGRLIAERAATIHDKVSSLVAELEQIGHQIERLDATWQGAMGRLASGRGNLVRLTHGLVELGVKVRNPIAKETLERDSGA